MDRLGRKSIPGQDQAEREGYLRISRSMRSASDHQCFPSFCMHQGLENSWKCRDSRSLPDWSR